MAKRIPTDVRFWAMVDASDAPDACWLWLGKRNRRGYGQFWDGTYLPSGSPRQVVSSRWAYESQNGPIPDGMFVCHTCDDPSCVRVAHLFLGSPADNSADMVSKGRAWARSGDEHGLRKHPERVARGEAHSQAYLTEDLVRAMRERHAATGMSYEALGREFGTTGVNASLIIRRKRWSHI